MTYALRTADIRSALDHLAAHDADVRRAIAEVGYPEERRRAAGFEALAHIILAQQISTKAAATIRARLMDMVCPLTPSAVLEHTQDNYRAIGLSRQKTGYILGLARAIEGGGFDPDALSDMPDGAAVEEIVKLKGFGRWSAEMYLMFSLGRPDIWPVDDLGVRAGLARLYRREDRPDEKEAQKIGESWKPYRSSMALLMWHYLHNAPM